jgi:CMP-N-acetylneuraminic acid synthetase
MKQQTITAMIPARIGSTRLPMKNLALIDGKPMISYVIQAAQKAGVFDKIVLNSDAALFQTIAQRYDVDFYHRPEHLGSSSTKSDDVVFDFISNNPCDIICWVNPTSPLQSGDEIRSIIRHFQKNDLDTLITVRDHQVHARFDNSPLNYTTGGQFAQTQELKPVQLFVYSVMMWRSELFVQEYKKKGYAFFIGNTGFFPVSRESAIIIKRKEDLLLAEQVIKNLKQGQRDLSYDIAAQNESI